MMAMSHASLTWLPAPPRSQTNPVTWRRYTLKEQILSMKSHLFIFNLIIALLCSTESFSQAKLRDMTWEYANEVGDSIVLSTYLNLYFNVLENDTTVDLATTLLIDAPDSTIVNTLTVETASGDGIYRTYYKEFILQEIEVKNWVFNGAGKQFIYDGGKSKIHFKTTFKGDLLEGALIEYGPAPKLRSISFFTKGEFMGYIYYDRVPCPGCSLKVSPLEIIIQVR